MKFYYSIDEALNDPDFCEALDNLDLENCYQRFYDPTDRATFYHLLKQEDINPFSNMEVIPDNLFTSSELSTILLSFPDNITDIGRHAFYDCRILNMNLPKNLRSIDAGAFQECRILKRVIIPDLCEEICDSAFAHCNELEEITLGRNLEMIDIRAFWYCTKLKKVNNNSKIKLTKNMFPHSPVRGFLGE